ncbi:MAG: toll/interleukin-1 receptor domain-containing protein [Sphingobium sp.]
MDTAARVGTPVRSGAADLAEFAKEQLTAIVGGNEPERYAAFISYSHADMECARWLHKAIEHYRVPRALVGTQGDRGTIPARLRPVFRDEDELSGASELGPKLEGALVRSNALIVICSPSSARSIWVDKEIRAFKRINPAAPVFALIASGSPGDPERPCFPQPLLFALDEAGELDRARPLEPLAPDLQKNDRNVVKLKLIAGLLGTSFDSLYRRDRRRARRIGAVLGTAAFILIIALSGLSIAAVTYARMAVHQRNEAQAARKLAEENADKAERRAWLAQASAEAMRKMAAEGQADCAQ